ncbi:hypothetical protein [Paludibacterium denitrificans]|uniref:Uncharacterized protein n=1 Tax=Paludibacterium denitrificans TaxID=2675226 RepID=A0A844GDB2_9NEIS|nr:hypothetical protein [Paludibacterium denitrificans]MTD32565.1 hypothetical protein [Paludibacterium denitrificans]
MAAARRVIALALLGSLLLHALLLWGLPVGKAGGGGGANDGRAEQGLAVRLRTTVTPRRQPAPFLRHSQRRQGPRRR